MLTDAPEECKLRGMSFNQVFENNKPISGLWERGGSFYGQIRIPEKGTRRFRLYNEQGSIVATLEDAKEAYQRLKRGRTAGEYPGPVAPVLREYAARYLAFTEELEVKSEATCSSERFRLNNWVRLFGSLRLHQITRQTLNEFAVLRKREGVGNATINLDVTALSALLRFAKEEGVYTNAPITKSWEALPSTPEVRPLLTSGQIDALVHDLRTNGYCGESAADYVYFLAYSGSRRSAGVKVKWADVDFASRRVRLMKTKGNKAVTVDFNPKLEEHLNSMFSRRTQDVWLFPINFNQLTRVQRLDPALVGSHQRGFVDAIQTAAKRIGLDFHIHDLRHYFASRCIMSGVDFRTTAQWLGHADNGMLAARRYSHLSPEHNQAAAQKVVL